MTNKINPFFNSLKKTIILSMIVITLFSPYTYAKSLSEDLTGKITYKTNNGVWAGSTIDGNYESYWYTDNAAYKYLQIKCKKEIKYLYVCYAFKPSELVIQTSEDGNEWKDEVYEYADEFYHVTYTFDAPVKLIRIKGTDDSKGKFGIIEVKVFSEGELPSYVQNWQPAYDKVDMLIFSAHPDDEAVFFSGLIPYYAGEMDKKVTVVYMTASEPYRRSEALNYIWAMHQTNLPIFAYFKDVYEENIYNYTKATWKEDKTIDYMVSIIREKKPDIIVSHDLNGEYGHGNHMFTAKCLLDAVVLANDPEYHQESYEKFGVHEVKKLYLHLYEENQIHLDVFDEPLDEYNGLTAIEAANVGILKYASQLKYPVVRVHDSESDFSCYDYGLAYTTVGYDKEGKDMFENIEPEPTPTIEPTSTPKPTNEPIPTVSPSPTTLDDEGSDMELGKIATIIICVIAGIIFLICVWLIVLIARKLSKNK